MKMKIWESFSMVWWYIAKYYQLSKSAVVTQPFNDEVVGGWGYMVWRKSKAIEGEKIEGSSSNSHYELSRFSIESVALLVLRFYKELSELFF